MTDFPDLRVDVAFGTDPATRPGVGAWTTVSTDNPVRDTLTIDRGMDMKTASIETGTASIVFDNVNRKLDPSNTSSSYSPNVKPRKRIRVGDVVTALRCDTGDYASTPDSADFDITGDLDIRARIAVDDWSVPADRAIISNWSGSTSGGYQLALIFGFEIGGTIELKFSDGATTHNVPHEAAHPFVDGESGWVRVTLDTNDGSGNYKVKFYTSTDQTLDHTKVRWKPWGDPHTASSAAPAASALTPRIGLDQSGSAAFDGYIHSVAVLDGIDGTVNVDVRFSDADEGDSTVDGRTGETWTLQNNAAISEDGPTRLHFTGFVDRWPPRWEQEDAQVNVKASDLFALIADDSLPISVLDHTIKSLSPTAYWPHGETIGTYMDDVVGSNDGTYNQPVTNEESVAPFDGIQSVVFDRSDQGRQFGKVLPLNGASSPTGVSIVQWIRPPISTTNSAGTTWKQNEGELIATTVGGSTYATFLGLPAAGTSAAIQTYMDDGTNSGTTTWGDQSIWDGQPHMIGLTLSASADTTKVYLDGVEINESDGESAWESLGIDVSVMLAGLDGGVLAIGHGISANDNPVHLGHTAWWSNDILNATEMASIWEAGINAWSGDTTDQRLHRILDVVGVDDDDRNIHPGSEVCGPTVLNGQNCLDYLRKIARTENGPLYVGGDGRITFAGQLPNNPTVRANFADTDGAGEVPWADLQIDYSLDRVVNTVDVRREGGNTITTIDADSRADYGVLDGGLGLVETLHRSASGVRSLGASIVARNHEPRTVIYELTVDGNDDDATEFSMLEADIGAAVNVVATPPGGGPTLDQDCFIESVRREFSSDLTWRAVYGLSEYITLPTFAWDTSGRGWDESVWEDDT